MSLIRVQPAEVGALTTALVQKMLGAANFNGLAPANNTQPVAERPFVTFNEKTTGEHVFSNPGPTTAEGTLLGTDGGLFVFNHKQPIVIEQLLAVFGGTTNYALTIVTPYGEVALASETGVTSALIGLVSTDPNWRPILMPGDMLKLVTSGGTVNNAVVRINVRLEQSS